MISDFIKKEKEKPSLSHLTLLAVLAQTGEEFHEGTRRTYLLQERGLTSLLSPCIVTSKSDVASRRR